MSARINIFSLAYGIIAVIAAIFIVFFYSLKEVDAIFLASIGICIFFFCFFNVRFSLLLLIFSMLLSPELEIGNTSAREITVRLDDLFLLVITFSWLMRVAVFKDVGFVRKNPLNLPIVIFSTSMVLSTILGTFYGTVAPLSGTLFVLKLVEYFFVFSAIVNFVREEKDVDRLLTYMFWVCAIICGYGVYCVVTGQLVTAPFEGLEEKNTLGGYLVLLGSVATGVLLHTQSRQEKYLLAGLLLALIVVLLFSLSRSSWVATFFSIIALFFATRKRSIYFAVIVAGLAVLPFLLPEVVSERAVYTISQTAAGANQQFVLGPFRFDTSVSARVFSYLEVLRQFPRHPFFGYGITGFFLLDGQFFRFLIELGAVGLAAFIWLLARLHNVILRGSRVESSPRLQGMMIGYYAGFWGIIGHMLSTNSLIIVRIAEPFWCLAALTVVCILHRNADGTWKSVDSIENAPAARPQLPSRALMDRYLTGRR